MSENPPAFPQPERSAWNPAQGHITVLGDPGMDLRDWFAGQAPEWWMGRAPNTIGGVRDALIARGIIPQSRTKEEAFRSYSAEEERKLLVAWAYEYADAMLAERLTEHTRTGTGQ